MKLFERIQNMSVCKLCMKSFKKLTPSHLSKKHGLKNREEYDEVTKDIEIPVEIQKKDDILMADLIQKKKAKKAIKTPSVAKPEVRKPLTIADVLANRSKG